MTGGFDTTGRVWSQAAIDGAAQRAGPDSAWSPSSPISVCQRALESDGSRARGLVNRECLRPDARIEPPPVLRDTLRTVLLTGLAV
jgi:hypothetical protein